MAPLLREENRVLREMPPGRRLRFTDAQRKRFAIRGKAPVNREAAEGPAESQRDQSMADDLVDDHREQQPEVRDRQQ